MPFLRRPPALAGARVRAHVPTHPSKTLLVALAALAFAHAGPAFAADVFWSNALGGSWNTPSNWSTNSVPASGDRVFIDLGGTYTVTLDVNANVASLSIGAGSGQQKLSGSSRTVTATDSISVTSTGVLDLSIGTVNATLFNRGFVVLRRNSVLGGTLTNHAGATLRVLGASGGSANLTVGPITNHGAIELTSIDGNFQSNVSGAGPLTNESDGTLTIHVGTGGDRNWATPMMNRGTVTLESTLYLNNGGLSQVIDPGGVLNVTLADLVLTQNAGSSFTNNGTVNAAAGRSFSVTGGVFANSGTLAVAGTLSFNGSNLNGTVSFPAGGLLDLTNCTINASVANSGLMVTHRSNTFNGALTVEAAGTLRNLGDSGGSAMLTTTNTTTNRGTIELTSTAGNLQSHLQGAGALTIEAGGVLRSLPGTGGERHLAKPTTNHGMVAVTHPLYIDNTGSQVNASDGVIDASQDLIVTQTGGAATFTNQGTLSIAAGRTASISGGTFTNTGTLSGTGSLSFAGTTAHLNTAITLGLTSVSMTSGTLNAPLGVTIGAGTTLNLSIASVNGAVTNQGVLIARRNSSLGAALGNQAGATLRVLGASGGSANLTVGPITNHGAIELTSIDGNFQSNVSGAGPLTNESDGTLTIRVGTGGDRNWATPMVNRGTVTLESVLYLNNNGLSQVIDPGGVLNVMLADLVLSQNAGSSFTNNGTVNVGVGRTFAATGGVFANSGTLAVAGTLSFNGSTLNGTVSFPAGGQLDLTNCTINASVANTGLMVTRRSNTFNGALTIEAAGTLRNLGDSGGSAMLTTTNTATNRGAIELTSTAGNLQSHLMGAGALTIEAGGVLRSLPGTGGERHLAKPTTNRGTITVEWPLYLDNGTMSFLNDAGGLIELPSSDLILTQSAAGSFTNRGVVNVGPSRFFTIAGGSFLNDVAGTFQGSGTISSSGPDIVNAGTIAPGASPGRLTFGGKVVQSATGRVRIEITGTQPITQYDVLRCTGQMVLGGTLQLAVLGGFVPPAGSSYVAIRYGTRTGTFSAIEGADLGGGMEFEATYTDTAVILSTGPLAILSVTSNRGGTSGTVSTVIHGVGLFAGQIVRLRRGAEQIVGNVLSVSPYGNAFAVTFDLAGATLGAWDVEISGSAGTVTMPGGFTVEETRPSLVSVQLVGRERVRIGRPATYDLICTNEGNEDAQAVQVWIAGIPAGSSWTLDPPLSPPPLYPGASPVDYSQIPIAVGDGVDSTVAILLFRVPAGQTVRFRLTVTPLNGTPFTLRTWSNPAYFHSPASEALIQCLTSIFDLVLDCGSLFLPPGANCARSMILYYLSMASSTASTTLAINVDDPPSQPELAGSLTEMLGGALLGGLETIADCAMKNMPLGRIVQFFNCAVSVFSTLEDCHEAMVEQSLASQGVSPVGSTDPNDKAGPSGVGLQRWTRANRPTPYTIYFENLETATAPAAEVVITDTLDTTKFDLSTVSLGPIRFGDRYFGPPPGATSCYGALDLRPERNLVVKIDARLDTGTGVLTWRLSSIDPATGEPPTDPDAGFLPPNVTAPEGEGSVQYTVTPLEGLVTGDPLGNRAVIVFDTNAPILTPVWVNTVDVTPPVTAVAALPAVTNALNITAHWTGSDVGSGFMDYTVYVSKDGGPDSVWVTGVTDTALAYVGEAGHTYAFYSVGRDSAENLEPKPGTPDAQTTIPSNVDVPMTRVAVFALHGARPNPSDGRLQIAFELPRMAAGSLDLFDLAGRRVVHRDIGALGPGDHTIDLGQGARIRSGIYFVRLQHAGQMAVRKVVVSQ